ncbi:unnamed protein product [Lampetra planeri]
MKPVAAGQRRSRRGLAGQLLRKNFGVSSYATTEVRASEHVDRERVAGRRWGSGYALTEKELLGIDGDRSCTSTKRERTSISGESSFARWQEQVSVDRERGCTSIERERLSVDRERERQSVDGEKSCTLRESGSCTLTGRAAEIFPWSSADQAAWWRTAMWRGVRADMRRGPQGTVQGEWFKQSGSFQRSGSKGLRTGDHAHGGRHFVTGGPPMAKSRSQSYP